MCRMCTAATTKQAAWLQSSGNQNQAYVLTSSVLKWDYLSRVSLSTQALQADVNESVSELGRHEDHTDVSINHLTKTGRCTAGNGKSQKLSAAATGVVSTNPCSR